MKNFEKNYYFRVFGREFYILISHNRRYPVDFGISRYKKPIYSNIIIYLRRIIVSIMYSKIETL